MFIAGVVLFILLVLFMLKALKVAFKIIMFVMFIFFLAIAATGFIVYTDSIYLKQGLEGSKTILLSQNGEIKAGMELPPTEGLNTEVVASAFREYNEEKIMSVQEQITQGTFPSKDNKDLTLIFNAEFFENESITLLGREIHFGGQKLQDFMNSENFTQGISALIPGMNEQELMLVSSQLSNSFETIQEFKNWVFFSLVAKKTADTKGRFIFDGISTDKISIQPEFISLKILKFMNAEPWGITAQVVKEV